jgi:hypothetical protein
VNKDCGRPEKVEVLRHPGGVRVDSGRSIMEDDDFEWNDAKAAQNASSIA